MKDIDDIRRENMLILEQEAGGATAAAERVDWSQPRWSNTRSGVRDTKTGKRRGMLNGTARKIEDSFDKPKYWLDVDHSEVEPIDLESHPDLAPVRRVKITFSAGIEGDVIELIPEDGPPIFFRRDWLRKRGLKADRLIAINVKGSSMEQGLWSGDLVVIDQNNTEPKDGKVFAVKYEGEDVIKRLRRDKGQWWLASDNADQIRYAPKLFTEDTQIIGRIVYKQSEEI
ncbi:MAG: S24 family peptidase [Betaproteobacteria bacterium]|nr:S24 family peptidase [Betaproteobacteria bacterium]